MNHIDFVSGLKESDRKTAEQMVKEAMGEMVGMNDLVSSSTREDDKRYVTKKIDLDDCSWVD